MLSTVINMFKKNWEYLLVALVITGFLRWKVGSEFFDIFGVIIFGGLVLVGLWELYSNKPMKNWMAFIIVIIGLMGLLVDSVTSINIIKSWITGG